MAQFHSMGSDKLIGFQGGVSGDLYYANDTQELFICAQVYLFPVDGILSGGMTLNHRPAGCWWQ
jgi:hypothetical protein